MDDSEEKQSQQQELVIEHPQEGKEKEGHTHDLLTLSLLSLCLL